MKFDLILQERYIYLCIAFILILLWGMLKGFQRSDWNWKLWSIFLYNRILTWKIKYFCANQFLKRNTLTEINGNRIHKELKKNKEKFAYHVHTKPACFALLVIKHIEVGQYQHQYSC